MKQMLFRMFLGIGAAIIVAGCNTLSGPPEIRQVSLNPSNLHPGDVAVLRVEVRDPDNIIDRVEGVVRDAPETVFRLRDDTGDGVWTMEVNVPFDAPPGEFVLDLVAYRRDGTPVPVRDAQGNVVELRAAHPFVVQYAQEP